jgi:hypothetical protein
VNLNRVPERTIEEIQLLTENELRKIASPHIVEGLRAFLIEPRLEMRSWDWHKPMADYTVWIVTESRQYDYGIAFSDYGFAPERPWGLIFLSHSNFDADYCWCPTLEEAYKESRLFEEFEEKRQET